MKWCEGCQGHYNIDHYDNIDVHLIGKRYGWLGLVLWKAAEYDKFGEELWKAAEYDKYIKMWRNDQS